MITVLLATLAQRKYQRNKTKQLIQISASGFTVRGHTERKEHEEHGRNEVRSLKKWRTAGKARRD